MTKENIYSEIESKCKLALIEAGETSIELKKNLKVNYKSQNQPVTNADLKINTFLKNFLKRLLQILDGYRKNQRMICLD